MQHHYRFLPTLLFMLSVPSACILDEWHDNDDERERSGASSDCRPGDTNRCPSTSEAQYLLESPELCQLFSFSCEEGQAPFTSACGCGCVDDGSGWAGGQPTPGMGPTCPLEQDGTFYLSRSERACQGISVTCSEGFESFTGPCGCGCQASTDTSTTTPPPPMQGECPSPDIPGVRYLCEDASRCEQIQFTCPEGEGSFRGPCGCGCIASTTNNDCPDPNAPGVLYVNPEACTSIDFACPEGCIRFDGECGCGCIEL